MSAGLNETTKPTGGGSINNHTVNVGTPLERPMEPDYRNLPAEAPFGLHR